MHLDFPEAVFTLVIAVLETKAIHLVLGNPVHESEEIGARRVCITCLSASETSIHTMLQV